MTLKKFVPDQNGSTAVEFAITAPVFFLVIFGIIEFCLVIFTQLALQHGVEMAARCGAIKICASPIAVMQFASDQSYGLSPPLAIFTVNTAACGNEVKAIYQFNYVGIYPGGPSITLNARSCFPSS